MLIFVIEPAVKHIYFAFFNSVFWILLYVYLQLLDSNLSITGLFGFLVFILVANAAPTWGWVNYPIETILLYAVFGFLMVLICSIPMFIIRSLQKDPAKRELLSRLFKRDIHFHDFVKTKDAIIETGMLVKVPLFIEQDEEIIVSTKDGKYVSRA